MWPSDVLTAVTDIFEKYTYSCCIEQIKDNVIVMTNGDKYRIENGHAVELMSG